MTDIGKLYAEGRELGWLVNAYEAFDAETGELGWCAYARTFGRSPKHQALTNPAAWSPTEEKAVSAVLDVVRGLNLGMEVAAWAELEGALQENVDARTK